MESECTGNARRQNSVIEAYNASAIEALAGTDAIINDLYKVSCGCKVLNITADRVDMEAFAGEDYSRQEISF